MIKKFSRVYPGCIAVLAGAVSLAVTGCSSTKGYDGVPGQGVQVANVRGNGCTFNAVNGKNLGSLVSSVEILPGKNEIVLTVDASNFNSRGPSDPTFKLIMDAQPGVNYVVTGRRGEGRLCAFPIIPDSGEPDFHHAAGCIVRE